MKIKFTKPKAADFNSLFKMVASNEKLAVKRSNKHLASSPISQWQDAEHVQLRGGASREENLLVSGRLAHPAPAMNSYSIITAARRASDYVEIDVGLLERLLGAAEYARGAKVSDGHYSNPEISKSATSIITDANLDTSDPYGSPQGYAEKVAENVGLRLLGAPIKWQEAEAKTPTGAVTPITKGEVLDENIKDFYERFLLQAIPLTLQGEDKRVSEEPKGPICGPTVESPDESTDGEPDEESGEASDEGKGESEAEEESEEEPEAEPKSEAKVRLEKLISETADSLSTQVGENAEKTFERRQEANAVESIVPEEVNYNPSILDGIGVPETFNYEEATGRLANWGEPKFKLSSISPIEDDGQSTKSFTGQPTNEAWKMSMLGNVNVFDAISASGDAASLLILADMSGSTIDAEVSTPFGKGNTQDVIWALAGKMLELSVNSRTYGFYSSTIKGLGGATLGIIEGQRANVAPRYPLGGGGTPTAEVLAWAADKSESSDEVIVLITDGMPDHKAPAMVRRMTDSGSRVAVVVVPNTNRYGEDAEYCLKVARRFGGEMSAVCDVRNPKSIEALNEFMANLIV